MQDWAALLNAIAALIQAVAWPAVVITAVLLLRGELPGLASRLRKLIFRRGDRELEAIFDSAMDVAEQLDDQSEEFEREVSPARDSTLSPSSVVHQRALGGPMVTSADAAYDPSRSIEEGVDPRLIIIELDREIEREARGILATFAHESNWRGVPTARMLERLNMPETIVRAAEEFRKIRNAVVHGRATTAAAVRAVDIGTTILDALRRTSRNVHTVTARGIPLFGDEAATEPRGIHGVRIQTRPAGGGQPSQGVYPTRREDYPVGANVTWEWNVNDSWGPSWYRDPDTGEVVKAFDSAAEFTGRELTELD